jgi:hypothetical protein
MKRFVAGYRMSIAAGLFLARGAIFIVMFLLQLTVGGADVRPHQN